MYPQYTGNTSAHVRVHTRTHKSKRRQERCTRARSSSSTLTLTLLHSVPAPTSHPSTLIKSCVYAVGMEEDRKQKTHEIRTRTVSPVALVLRARACVRLSARLCWGWPDRLIFSFIECEGQKAGIRSQTCTLGEPDTVDHSERLQPEEIVKPQSTRCRPHSRKIGRVNMSLDSHQQQPFQPFPVCLPKCR